MPTKPARQAAVDEVSAPVAVATPKKPKKPKKPTMTSWIDDVAAPSTADAPAKKAKARKSRKAAGEVQNAVIDEDSAFTAMFERVASTDIGDGLVTTEQSEQMIVGIELPSLALRYLFQHDVLTLGRNIMLVGLPGACKSALLAEFYRWVLLHRGMAGHCETENKDSPDLRNSLLWYDKKLMRRLFYHPASSQEAWMEAIETWIDAGEKEFAKVRKKKRSKPKKGENAAAFKARTGKKVLDDKPGWIYPMIYGIDSLTAVSGDATIEKIKKTGAPERRFADEARNLADWARTLADKMRGRPIIVASTNHLKPGQDDHGYPVDNIPGGKAMRYMNSMEIKMTKIGGIKAAGYSGNKIKLSCLKNSLGETNLQIVADLKWWWEVDEATDEAIQRTVWDWDTAAIDCLLAQKNRSAALWNSINEVVDIHVPSEGKRTLWSRELGIPSSSPVRFDEAGKILESRRDVQHELNKLLHIKPRTRFTPGVDYEDVQQHLRKAAERMETVYNPADLSPIGFLDDELTAKVNSKSKAKAKAASARKKQQEDDDDDDDD